MESIAVFRSTTNGPVGLMDIHYHMNQKIITPPPTTSYKENYDLIFKKKPSPSLEDKRCSYCDTMNKHDAVVCKNCGEELK
ncbi:MAG: zinc ribbon domain-containing protein [bacterium]